MTCRIMNLSLKEHYLVRESMHLLLKGYLLLSQFVVIGFNYGSEDRKHPFGKVIFIQLLTLLL